MGLSSIVRGTIERWQILWELREIRRDEASVNGFKLRGMLGESKDALKRGLRSRAIEVWNRAFILYPDLALTDDSVPDLLFQLKLYDEAEALMKLGAKRYPTRAFYLENLAMVSYERRDLPEAIRRCETINKKHPISIKGDWIAASAFRQLGRLDEAEAVLARGLRRDPRDLGLLIQRAQISEVRQDWTEAIERWRPILEEYNHQAGAVGLGLALTHLKRYEEADAILKEAATKWGNDLSLWFGIAYVAEHKGDLEEVNRRWQVVRKRFPVEPVGYMRGVGAVLQISGPAQADAIMLDGINYMPDDPLLLIEFAMLAHRRADWSEAARRWLEVRDRFPGRREGYERGAEALAMLGDTDQADAVRALNPTS